MALCVALTYTGLLLGAKRLLASATPAIVMCSENLIAAILLIPVVVILPFPVGLRSWLAVLIIGFVHTLLPVLLYFSGLRRVRADRVAVVMYSEPVSAMLFAAMFLSEPLTVAKALGGAAVVGAGILVSILEKRSHRNHANHCETGWANGA
jgi:drug/metabolite transporter (DMT)-like permease